MLRVGNIFFHTSLADCSVTLNRPHSHDATLNGAGVALGLLWALFGLALLDGGFVPAGGVVFSLGGLFAAIWFPGWIRAMNRAGTGADEHS